MKLILIGSGRMGEICRKEALSQGHEVIAAFDKDTVNDLIYAPACDAVIDFSAREALNHTAVYLQKHPCSYVCGTTGLTTEDRHLIDKISRSCPVMAESNFSYGFHMLCSAVNLICSMANTNWSIEISEIHHSLKRDKPGGSAVDLAHLAGVEKEAVHAMRGGDVNGVHNVFFFGEGEYLQLTHTAQDKRIFALGAIKAARWLIGKQPGQYIFSDMLEK